MIHMQPDTLENIEEEAEEQGISKSEMIREWFRENRERC